MTKTFIQSLKNTIKFSKYFNFFTIYFKYLPIPIIFLLVVRFGSNVPFLDEWSALVPVYEKFVNGTLHWSDIWAQHNEHRVAVIKIVALPILWLSNFDVRALMWASIFIAFLTFRILEQKIATNLENAGLLREISLSLLSFLIFSPQQAQNWLWGFQIGWFINILCVVLAGIESVSHKPLKHSIIHCCIYTIIASLCISSGMFLWFLCPLFLFCIHLQHNRKKQAWNQILQYAMFWNFIFLIFTFLFFSNYYRVSHHHYLELSLSNIKAMLLFVFIYLGSGIADNITAAKWFGVFILMYITFHLWKLSKQTFFDQTSTSVCSMNHEPEQIAATDASASRLDMFFLFIGLYAILSAFITSYGRISFGLGAAMWGRYRSVSALAWVCFLHFFTKKPDIDSQNKKDTTNNFSIRLLKTVKTIFLLLIFFFISKSYISGVHEMANTYKIREEDRIALLKFGKEAVIHFIEPKYIEKQVEFLKQNKLSCFSELATKNRN